MNYTEVINASIAANSAYSIRIVYNEFFIYMTTIFMKTTDYHSPIIIVMALTTIINNEIIIGEIIKQNRTWTVINF